MDNNYNKMWFIKYNFQCSETEVDTILSYFEMKNREFFHENFEEQVVILLNCPEARKVTCNVPLMMGGSQVGYIGKKAIKILRMDKNTKDG